MSGQSTAIDLFAENSDGIFRNLRGFKLNADMRLFLCKRIDMDSADASIPSTHRLTVYRASIKYNIPFASISRWLKKYKSGKVFHDCIGRPNEIDEQGLEFTQQNEIIVIIS